MKSLIVTLTVLLGTGSIASASSGVFCNPNNTIVQWVCNEYPQGQGWVKVDANCYHRETGASCSMNPPGGGQNPGNGQVRRNTIFVIYSKGATYYSDRSGGYCAFASQEDVDTFRRNTYGYSEPVAVSRVPSHLRYRGTCSVY